MKQAVILAGGLGTRLRPITEKIPKPLVPINDKPFLYWQIQYLKKMGVQKVLLLVAYLGEQVEACFGDGSEFGLSISYSYEQSPLGTGGALKLAYSKLENEFFLLNGDSFLWAPLDQMEHAWNDKVMAMMAVYDNKIPTAVTPNLEISDQHILSYNRQGGPKYKFIDAGVYLLRKSLLRDAPEGVFQLESLLIPQMALSKVGAYFVNERFYDIGTLERLREFEAKVNDYF